MTRNVCVTMEDRVSRVLSAFRPEIRHGMTCILTQVSENLSREQFSSLTNYGSTYFSRLFKAEVGMSYTDYVLQARLLSARDLLRSTDMPISEIARACGFHDVSYFIGRFREFQGMTPREWRENNGETTA